MDIVYIHFYILYIFCIYTISYIQNIYYIYNILIYSLVCQLKKKKAKSAILSVSDSPLAVPSQANPVQFPL